MLIRSFPMKGVYGSARPVRSPSSRVRWFINRVRAGWKSRSSLSSNRWMSIVVPSSSGWSQIRPPSTSISSASSSGSSSPPFRMVSAYSFSLSMAHWISSSVGSIDTYRVGRGKKVSISRVPQFRWFYAYEGCTCLYESERVRRRDWRFR